MLRVFGARVRGARGQSPHPSERSDVVIGWLAVCCVCWIIFGLGGCGDN